jgi:hypothetical protein
MQKLTDARVRAHFLGWQCRIRQMAMRDDGGRPSPGMRPRVFRADGSLIVDGLTTVLVPEEPQESTAFFRFNVQKSNDPKIIYEKGLRFLQATHFSRPDAFRDELTAVLGAGSDLANTLLKLKSCLLEFDQWRQTFRMIASVRKLKQTEDAWQATVWHNRTFNPELPGDVTVLGLTPQWKSAQAHPEAT